jgi:hypothetical protein
LALALASSVLLASGLGLVLWLAGGAAAATVLARPAREAVLALHGAGASVLAIGVSGLAAVAATLWLTRLTEWPTVTQVQVVALSIALACFIWNVRPGLAAAWPLAAARLILAAMLVVIVASAMAIAAGFVALGTPPDAGAFATTKSIVIASLAVALAAAGRARPLADLARLSYPLLVIGGLKIVVEDFPRSRPATLFLALACYGIALIAAPRIMRRWKA